MENRVRGRMCVQLSWTRKVSCTVKRALECGVQKKDNDKEGWVDTTTGAGEAGWIQPLVLGTTTIFQNVI